MTHRHLIADDAIEKIKKQGCCLGKYRILLSGGYYCFLEKIFDCPHQDKRYVKNASGYMLACKTNNQLPCEQCERYIKAQDELANETKDIIRESQVDQFDIVY
jgi:hypothetical protein